MPLQTPQRTNSANKMEGVSHIPATLPNFLHILVILAFAGLLMPGGTSADILQISRDALPKTVPATAYDSILTTVYAPAPTYPEKAISERKSGVVWFRLSVGEGGVVRDIEMLDCNAPGYGFEEEAERAVKEARFRPAWDGIYPKLHWGYCAVPFTNPRSWRQRRRRAPNDIIGVGLDAPLLTNQEALLLEYPAEAAEQLLEGDVMLRLLINKRGRVSNARDLACTVPDHGFEEAAKQAVKKATYPRKTKPRKEEYSAYQIVKFRLTDRHLVAAGLPTLAVPSSATTPPVLESKVAKLIPLAAAQKKLSGTVSLGALVDASGQIVTVRTINSSGHYLFDSAATADAYRSKYSPAMRDGTPVAAWHTFDVPYLDYPQIRETVIDPIVVDEPRDLPPNEPVADMRPASYKGIEHPDIQPKFEHYEKAKYPLDLEEAGIEGTVKLAALIDIDGSVLDSRMARPSQYREFDSVAIAAIPHHKFQPGTTDGQPVKSWSSWVVRFREGSKDVVSNDTTRVIVKPEIVEMHDPDYPDNARQAGIEGTVWLLLYVDKSGAVIDSKILQTSGTTALDLAALDVAHLHRFTPALVDGEPANFWLRYRVEFEIGEESD